MPIVWKINRLLSHTNQIEEILKLRSITIKTNSLDQSDKLGNKHFILFLYPVLYSMLLAHTKERP